MNVPCLRPLDDVNIEAHALCRNARPGVTRRNRE